MTPATTWLAPERVVWRDHVYDDVDHGGTRESARQLGSDEHRIIKTRVMVDGISPFNAQRGLRVFVGRSILSIESILINGGRRGCLIEITPSVQVAPLGAQPVGCALDSGVGSGRKRKDRAS